MRSRANKLPWPRRSKESGSWLKDHWRVAGESIYEVNSRLGTSLLVWLLIGIALALPAGLYLLQSNIDVLGSQWQGRPGITVYFAPGSGDEEITALEKTFTERDELFSVWQVSSSEALDEFRSFSGIEDALALLDENPLPASLRATIADNRTSEDLERIAQLARSSDGVEEVVIEKSWLERLTAISQVVNRLGVVLGVLFAIGAVLVTATSVRLAIESQLEELRVLKLVGATDAYIRRPFLYFGLLYGIGGGLFGAMLISGVLLNLEAPVLRLIGSYGGDLELAGFDPMFLLGLLSLGGALGVIGAMIATRSRIKGLEVV